ncbi:hypothetical protein B7P43_G10230 [Cryptotermes secundus]|nr:hypothetical protein B7P43_G10230 [Cryptotermes secundus]
MVIGHDQCKNLHQEAFLVYDGAILPHEFNEATKSSLNALMATMMKTCSSLSDATCRPQEMKELHKTDVQHLSAEQQKPHADMKLYIPFDVYVYDAFDDKDVNFRFMLEESINYPSYLYNRKAPIRLPQVDRLTFKYPPSPLLSQPESVPKGMLCSDDCRRRKFCECLHVIHTPLNVTLDIVLVNEGHGSNHSSTFHLHGYNFLVLGSESLGRPIDVAEIQLSDSHGLLSRNLVDAPRKDTVVVPSKGYAIIRLFTDNPGSWLFEARSTSSVIGGGMQFIVQVGEQTHLPPVPSDFPRCGDHKKPIFVF